MIWLKYRHTWRSGCDKDWSWVPVSLTDAEVTVEDAKLLVDEMVEAIAEPNYNMHPDGYRGLDYETHDKPPRATLLEVISSLDTQIAAIEVRKVRYYHVLEVYYP